MAWFVVGEEMTVPSTSMANSLRGAGRLTRRSVTLPNLLVPDELKLSVNAVLQAKSRILKRLREEAGELLA